MHKIANIEICCVLAMPGADTKVLGYHDLVLRQSDLDILNSASSWLNDQIIEFYFEFLARERYASRDIALLGGSQTFFILHGDLKDVEAALAALDLPSKILVAFAVNDNQAVDLAEGGSHWSLLIFDRVENQFRHYDSLRGHNSAVARAIVTKAAALLHCEPPFEYLEVDHAPQQANSHDCGVYVLAVADKECAGYVAKASEEELSNEVRKITARFVKELRSDLLNIVNSKIKAKT